jgi:hypothetical protein
MNLHSTLHTATCGQASLDYWENMGNSGMDRTGLIEGHGKAMAKVAILADTG